MNYYGAVMKKYATFEGRARRAEYWAFFGVNLIIAFIIQLLYVKVNSGFEIILLIFNLIVFLPGLALQVRRLHDVGKSGWFILVPIYGWLLIWFFDSENGSNRFGENPKFGGLLYNEFLKHYYSGPYAEAIFEQGEVIGKEITIDEKPITIGIGKGNIIRYSLEKSPHISRNHCRLFMKNNMIYVEDFSTNGCYVLTKGGEKKHINNRNEILREGDVLYIGSSNTKLAIRKIIFRGLAYPKNRI